MSDNDDTRQEKQMGPKTRRLIGNAQMVADAAADKLPELIKKLTAPKPRTKEDN